jgi:NADH:ubiquinone oxidoreductase subunit
MWLHHATDKVSNKIYDWQKEHSPNLTGTQGAYYPKGHILSGGKRAKNTNDYEPFQPPTNSGESL